MKNSSTRHYGAVSLLTWRYAFALTLVAVGVELAPAQTTLKFAGSKEVARTANQPPVAVNRITQTTATVGPTAPAENEIYIFSFLPQRNAPTTTSAPAKIAVPTAQPQPAPAAGASTGDVYAILVQAGRMAGSAPPAPQPTATPSVANPGPVVATAKPQPVVTPAPTPGDMFSALATAGRKSNTPAAATPALTIAQETPKPQRDPVPALSTETEFRSVLTKSTDEAIDVATTTPPAAVIAVNLPEPVVATPKTLTELPQPVAAAPQSVVLAPQPVASVPQPAAAEPEPTVDLFSTLVSAGRDASTRPAALPPAPATKQPQPTVAANPLSDVKAPTAVANADRSKMSQDTLSLSPHVSSFANAAIASPPVVAPTVVAAPTIVATRIASAPVASAPLVSPPNRIAESATPAGDNYAVVAPIIPRVSDLPELAPLAPATLSDNSPVLSADKFVASERFAMLDTQPMQSISAATETTNSGGAAFVGSVTCNPGTGPLGPVGCPYHAGQSGAPNICGVDCGANGAPCCATWNDSRCIPWSLFGPGEYVGPARSEHVSSYYLRVNDLVTLTYIASRRKNAQAYRIGVGDRLRLEWLRSAAGNEASLDREIMVQPDGTISLPLVGELPAAGKTVKDLQDDLVKAFGKYQREPQITVTPLEVNTALEDILKAVTSQSRSSGQAITLRLTPEGTIQAPGIGSVFAQGLTLEELRSELEARYEKTMGVALLVSPSLTERATSYVFLGGEVKSPGRYTLEGPTTVMQAVTLAGGWNNGGNLHQVVVFRRDENWCLKATKIDIRAPFYGKDPCPVNDVWLRDNDLLIVPKERILCAADVIELYFTRGVYAVFPITFVKDFSRGSSVVPVP